MTPATDEPRFEPRAGAVNADLSEIVSLTTRGIPTVRRALFAAVLWLMVIKRSYAAVCSGMPEICNHH